MVIPRASLRRGPPCSCASVGGLLGEGDNRAVVRFRKTPGDRSIDYAQGSGLRRFAFEVLLHGPQLGLVFHF